MWLKEGPEAYHRRTKEEADKYKNYTGHHTDVSAMFDDKLVVDDMEIGKRAEMSGKRCRERVNSADPRTTTVFQSDANGKCECSCCALGQNFWDSKKKMRFLFGVGG